MNDAELFEQYRATGDLNIRNQIVEKYLYIAALIAKKFVGRGVEYDDLFQVASLALIKSVDRFEPERGAQFSTFVTPTITGEIKNYFRDRSRLVHLPRRVSELRGAIRKTGEEFMSEHGRKPTARELSALLNVSEEEILRSSEAGGVVSLDKTVESEKECSMSLHEVLAGDDVFEELETRDAVRSAVSVLDETERQIVAYRYKDELSQVETARRMGMSQMNVSRLERKILQKLREVLSTGMA